MKIIKLMLTCLLLSVTVFAKQRNGIAELIQLAKARHMHYWIFCVDWQDDPNAQFQANLCMDDCHRIYIEDGAKGFWAEHGATQEEAARRLVDAIIAGKAPILPSHNPDYERQHSHKQCPPPIEGPSLSSQSEGR